MQADSIAKLAQSLVTRARHDGGWVAEWVFHIATQHPVELLFLFIGDAVGKFGGEFEPVLEALSLLLSLVHGFGCELPCLPGPMHDPALAHVGLVKPILLLRSHLLNVRLVQLLGSIFWTALLVLVN